jgi:hypothetical protein
MRFGLIAVAAALNLATGPAWAQCTGTFSATPDSFNSANAPTGTHLANGSAAPQCTVNAANQVSCNAYQLGGVGHTNATANLLVQYAATLTKQTFPSKNGQLKVGVVTPDSSPVVLSFTYTLTFDGFTAAYITIKCPTS